MRADGGYDGILKYMMNYNRCPERENGYIARHVRDLPQLKKVRSFFDGGANAGVHIRVAKNLVRDADLDFAPELFYPTDIDGYPRCTESPNPHAGHLFGACGIPTVYHGTGLCDAVFGENARHFSPETLGRGVILDAAAAKIYREAGEDVGITACIETGKEQIFSLRTPWDKDGDPLIQNERCRHTVSRFALKEKCKPVLFAKTAKEEVPLAYTYENAEGKRFLVLTTDGFWLTWNNSPISGSYPMQEMLKQMLPWVARQEFPVTAPVAPQLYLMCRETADALSVLVCNMSEDALPVPEFAVRDTFSQAEWVDADGTIDGKKVRFSRDIPAFSFAAFRLRK